MRSCAAAVLSLSIALHASSAQTPAPAADWPRQNADALAAFQADRAKERPKMEKALVELDRKFDQWLAVARDDFGITDNARMDPNFFERRRKERQNHLAMEDSSAARLIAARQSGNATTTLAALRARHSRLELIVVENDSVLSETKEVVRSAQRSLDMIKGEDRPGQSPARRNQIKALIDFYDKLLRAVRARTDYHNDQSKAFKAELTLLGEQIAATTPFAQP